MRCERMHCTMAVSHCLDRQAQVAKYAPNRRVFGVLAPNLIAHTCFHCPQGAEVKKNGGNIDVEKIIEQTTNKIKEEKAQGFQPPLMRTCQECKAEKGVSQFHGNNQVCRKCLINKTRARMKEANKPELLKQLAEVGEGAPPITQFEPEPAHYIEAGGLRIQVCQRCLKRFLGVGKGRITLTAGRKREVVIMP